MAKYDVEFKFKVVSAYLNGDGSYLVLARRFNIPSKSNIVKWVGIYKNYGKDGLVRKRFHKNYTVQFKIDVINYRLRTEKSFPEIALIFNISEPSLVRSWLKTWEAEGIKGLTRAKGRPSMSNKAN